MPILGLLPQRQQPQLDRKLTLTHRMKILQRLSSQILQEFITRVEAWVPVSAGELEAPRGEPEQAVPQALGTIITIMTTIITIMSITEITMKEITVAITTAGIQGITAGIQGIMAGIQGIIVGIQGIMAGTTADITNSRSF